MKLKWKSKTYLGLSFSNAIFGNEVSVVRKENPGKKLHFCNKSWNIDPGTAFKKCINCVKFLRKMEKTKICGDIRICQGDVCLKISGSFSYTIKGTGVRLSFVFPHEFTEKRAATIERRRLGNEQTASCGYVQCFQNFRGLFARK